MMYCSLVSRRAPSSSSNPIALHWKMLESDCHWTFWLLLIGGPERME